jgi:hypothetical protein
MKREMKTANERLKERILEEMIFALRAMKKAKNLNEVGLLDYRFLKQRLQELEAVLEQKGGK